MSEYSASCSEWYVISESGKPTMSTRSTRRQSKSEVESYIIASNSVESKNDQSENVISELPILIEKLELEESKNVELSQKIEFLEEQNNQLEDLNSSLIEDRGFVFSSVIFAHFGSYLSCNKGYFLFTKPHVNRTIHYVLENSL